MDAFETLQIAREAKRASGKAFIKGLCGDFMELRGDRRFGDDHAVIGGIGRLGEMPITVVALEKGGELADKAMRNFGCAHPEGYRKALRLMKQAEKFNRPVLCLIDTQGAFCGIGAEERGQGQAIAENLMEMMALKVPVVSILLGEGGSGGALALAVANEVWMLENAVYSVISPEGCASILWKNSAMVKEASECLRITSEDLQGLGVVERVVDEFPAETLYPRLRADLLAKFAELSALSAEEVCARRYARFRKFGAFKE